MPEFYKTEKGDAKDIKPRSTGLPGPRKAAIVLVALGTEASSKIFQKLSDAEVEKLTTEIARLDGITTEMREQVLQEFHHLTMAQQFLSQGGVEYARELLEAALGPVRAKEILDKVQAAIRTTGFNLLENVDPQQLVNFIQKEHPQTIALLLAHMNAQNAANILSSLPAEMQVEVSTRIATMESISPEVIDQVEQVLSDQVRMLFGGNVSEIGGVKAVAEMLNMVDRGAEKNILGNLERENPELAAEIKNLMFVFEDILLIDDRSMQRVLKEVDTKELSLALKGANEDVQNKFFKNMSSRAAEMIKEEMEYMGPVRLKDVEECQQRIVDVIRKLEDDGEIVISGRGGEDDVVV
ncbi:MAG: flagellar motor switch protein FliG [Candidatus Raymondbacteria bacterium RifOxyA12_full_50_37]|uniref:Flagellar motor switch protein FliG n=1 Tax=Candidatus Raymondbacteria bacterium RIFOXYD12_FULL_49_13 TaxID=1817890 RepID=A0A1F7EZX7_UNCRA|nr:MAG: flagellar motor switch protein FliG [Candidatus Raymondbacteria bacterium RifOxyA12_full_50_37]OGJ92998.1 MAG: flagellar motor switch protein FliG [Candidatus Raymondbacteria bacterium RIFOXYA2_FULL_49_16]OGJ99911.1 MAG: flagellar motor switch protein FliG [Candidatus Raymondbacteria bacterium RIFOXYD12_FULL_49_13]OGK01579.1 MAG: flagellar motor switch protein FliG [Candidatus Raymondbacteria bacterium RifOxyC12_full_50_8]OGP40794.1 MAG: flagellar motor switch protein FliG [Candidatus R